MFTGMFRRSLSNYWLLLLFVVLAVVSCKPALDEDPATTPAQAATVAPQRGGSTEVVAESDEQEEQVAGCPEAGPGSYQLVAVAHGICFLYPESYDAWQADDGTITLYIRSVTTVPLPLASISATLSRGQTLETLAAQRVSDYGWPDTPREAITLGGEPAVMLDNLPGQDTNRRVVAVYDRMVYDLVFHGTGPNYGEVGEQAEALYQTVISSLQFMEIQLGTPLVAGPECPLARPDAFWYANETAGYCLLAPTAYTAVQLDPEAREMAFGPGTVQDTAQARLFIKVSDAQGRSLDNLIANYETELEERAPGLVATRSLRFTLDGEVAYAYEQVPGQELARQVLTLHDGRLYTLTFVPDDPAAGETYVALEELYDMVMDSFSFLWEADTVVSNDVAEVPGGNAAEKALYRDPEVGFEFDYPTSWYLLAREGGEENSRGSVASFASWPSAGDSAKTRAGETRFDVAALRWEPLDLTRYVAMRKKAWAASGVIVVAEEPWMLGDDLEAAQFLLDTPDAGAGFVLITLIGDHFVALSGAGDLEELARIGRTLRPSVEGSQGQ